MAYTVKQLLESKQFPDMRLVVVVKHFCNTYG